MASIRRTLSPAYHDRHHYINTVFSSSSPSHKLPSSNANYSALASSFQKLIGSVFMRRYNRKGQWRRIAYRCVLFFFAGILLGIFPFGNLVHDIPHQRNEKINFDIKTPHADDAQLVLDDRVPGKRGGGSGGGGGGSGGGEDTGFVIDPVSLSLRMNDEKVKVKVKARDLVESERIDFVTRKQLIVVTPTYNRAFQSYFLNRLGQVLRLVPPPVLWVVVEMNSASMETAELLRKTGVMYRHLVCGKNSTDLKDRGVHQRNTALEHIEHHRLDGIVYFADDDNVYSLELFQAIRDISRFGTWPLAMLAPSKNKAILEGPVCNGSQVIGWHTNEKSKRLRRFHVDMSGFAFNSSIMWDPKRWRRPTSKPIRQLDSVKEGFQETTFIEQLVEDERQMEGLSAGCKKIMNWHLHLDVHNVVYPKGWMLEKNLDAVIPIK
ncbi:unnamed protein product [Lathyrus oleraceus]|uniref:Glycosyltransferases n=1 Tax=Pisum sativum TaxID=3888 RepID=A0A9D4WM51_PEA|nr:probable beta-1,4-xylosyltransferase IRX9H [Pisum sativum]KAI5403081.1 hypothetical protein KIW84_050606 [Pisum sativum]